jgi:hypothetical protein
MKVSINPFEALRYIIIYEIDNDIFKFLFADSACSHSSMEERYQEEHFTDNLVVVGGGFYSINTETKELSLFGRSSTYGLPSKSLSKAINSFVMFNNSDYKIIANQNVDNEWVLNQGDDNPYYVE